MRAFFAIIGAIAAVAGLIGFGIQIYQMYVDSAKQRFATAELIQQSIASKSEEYMGRNNDLLSTGGTAIRFMEDGFAPSYPRAIEITRSIKRNQEFFETVYGPIAQCVRTQGCSKGEVRKKLCDRIEPQYGALKNIHELFKRTEQLRYALETESNSEFPASPSLAYIARDVCAVQ